MAHARLIHLTAALAFAAGTPCGSQPPQEAGWPDGSKATAPREEIRPAITHDPAGGPDGTGTFVITTDAGVGQHGWVQKTYPVTGGKTYRFQAQRRTENVESPRRSAGARIIWLDPAGKQVPADVPAGREKEFVPVPTAEPEHPPDGETDKLGWTRVAGTYRAPAKATQAVGLAWAASLGFDAVAFGAHGGESHRRSCRSNLPHQWHQ